MFLWRSATVTVFLTLLSVRSGADAADADQKNNKKMGDGLLGRVFRNLDNVGDEPLAEDEGYWERFLQATIDSIPSAQPSAPPTPGPLCDVTVSIIVPYRTTVLLLYGFPSIELNIHHLINLVLTPMSM